MKPQAGAIYTWEESPSTPARCARCGFGCAASTMVRGKCRPCHEWSSGSEESRRVRDDLPADAVSYSTVYCRAARRGVKVPDKIGRFILDNGYIFERDLPDWLKRVGMKRRTDARLEPKHGG